MPRMSPYWPAWILCRGKNPGKPPFWARVQKKRAVVRPQREPTACAYSPPCDSWTRLSQTQRRSCWDCLDWAKVGSRETQRSCILTFQQLLYNQLMRELQLLYYTLNAPLKQIPPNPASFIPTDQIFSLEKHTCTLAIPLIGACGLFDHLHSDENKGQNEKEEGEEGEQDERT
ncbi:hypothetical protein FGO68_gene612 [Halteria grandinella]|uniref:Uncharacterized protein n=1 Tax=Halteria grandinella TaxID=5974 RepID=A0A8J8N9P3_HALGN|nr:hypothetical protein FGO68_gene612 [Halteria grandinella]